MQKISFKLRIFAIFLIPVVSMVYFTFYFVTMKHEELENACSYKLFAQMTKATSNFIHNIQLERGLNAGYIVVKNKNAFKSKLLEQEKLTDETYKQFILSYDLQKKDTNKINQLVLYKNTQAIKKILKKLHYLKNMRKSVLNGTLSFKENINYYSYINQELMQIIYNLTTAFKTNGICANCIYQLEEFKEYAGLERAYIYNQLLSKKNSQQRISEIEQLIIKEGNMHEEFISDASVEYLKFYNIIIKDNLEKKLQNMRKLFFENKLGSKNAKAWFKISTDRINNYEQLSIFVLNSYINNMNIISKKARNALMIALGLWLLLIFAFLLLIYILNRLIDKEAKLMDDLRISSYAFEWHEAMTVTDPNGNIIKVNKAFSEITGYHPNEVLGKNPRILKSYKHSDEFYKNMWLDLHTKGIWSGEIYNKRKNGEIYMEKLSITAIKNNKGITTHYIAQFLDVSDLKKAQDEAVFQASHDFLTELPNRKSMLQKLREEFARAKRHNFLSGFLFIDLDGFKEVNDTYGHSIGDKLLVKVSKRFKNCLREEDFIARMGGDEFCIMLFDLDSDIQDAINNVKIVSEKILFDLSNPFFIEKSKIQISASIGIKIFPDGTKDINDIIDKADIAMYKAKEQGKNQIVISKE